MQPPNLPLQPLSFSLHPFEVTVQLLGPLAPRGLRPLVSVAIALHTGFMSHSRQKYNPNIRILNRDALTNYDAVTRL